MAPLFSKVGLNKLWHDVQNEETLICAKFGKDLFNISKVIGRKKVAQFFLTHSVDNGWYYTLLTNILDCFHLSSGYNGHSLTVNLICLRFANFLCKFIFAPFIFRIIDVTNGI